MGKINKSTEKTTFDASDYVFGWLNSEAEGSERKTKWSVIATGIATYLGITNFGSGKIITAAERTKLNGIATGAQVNTVTSVFGNTGAISASSGDYDANQIDYDNTITTDLSAPTDLQDAINQLYARTELSQDTTPVLGGNLDPGTYAYAGAFKHTGTSIGFFSTPPTTKASALTVGLTSLAQAGSFTPDYAIQAMTNTTPYGFVTADEAETVLSIISNLQARVNDLESTLSSYGLLP